MAKPKKTLAKKAASPPKERKKRDKPTIEAMSESQRQELLFAHRRKLKPLLEAEKNAKRAVSDAYEAAKDEGLPRKEIILAISLESKEGQEKLRNELASQFRIARWVGAKIGHQLDMFPKVKREDEIFDMGKIAALDDQPRRPPDHLNQKDAQTWMSGHDQGRSMRNVNLAQNFKPLAEVVSELLPPTPAGNGHDQLSAA